MKVAVVAPSEVPARRANTLQVMKMTQAIASLGHEVRLAVPAEHPSRARLTIHWDELAHHYGLQAEFPIDWLQAHPQLRRYDYGFRSIGWARRQGADLIYTRLPQAAAIASRLGMPCILEMHDLPQGKMGPLLFRAFTGCSGARRLVVITHGLLNDLVDKLGAQLGPPFTLVAPDGVDLSRYSQLPDIGQARQVIQTMLGRSLGRDSFIAGYTGHLYRGRGVELLLQIASRLPEVKFLLAGGEPNNVEIFAAQVSQNGLENVILTGFIPNAELPVYQAACDVLLMPYQRQVAASSGGDIARYLSPMKLFEYMACGRAIVSSNLPVLQEVLQPEFAVLLPPEDINAWVAAIRELSSDAQRRTELGLRARANVSRYTWEGRARNVLEGIAPL